MGRPEGNPGSSGAKIALALSGGGARAMAFHLGCLRALDRAGLLDRIATISSVSGGSVLAALYCSHAGSFADFEAKARKLLARGLARPVLRTALTTPEGLKALAVATALAIDRLGAFLARLALRPMRLSPGWLWLRESPIRRSASRTTMLRRVLSGVFERATLSELRADRPKLIIVACELRTKSAFYFASDRIGTWRYGSADPSGIEIAHAVAASASYPAFLPALDERMRFEKDGVASTHRVILTDGGVYDNLGLSPLWPDRDPKVSLHAGRFDRIIACRAGYALNEAAAASFWPSRMLAVVEAIHARAQNLAMNRLFDLKAAGRIEAFLLAYLGQDDAQLRHAPADLVSRDEAAGYPTDFSAMPEAWIDRLSRRGEQLVDALVKEHWPELAADGRRS